MDASLDPSVPLVQSFPGRTVVVLGDVMLDQFLIGRVNRISPEAPVPVVEFERDEFRLGGAANVAHNVHALGGRPLLVGVVGDDDSAACLRRELEAAHLDASGLVVDASRPTTRKLRIVTTRHQQVARVDYEQDREVAADVEATLMAACEQAIDRADVVVVSDYLKGVVTRALMTSAMARARQRGVKVLVDPKIPHLPYYAGATVITPNHHEAEVATHRRIRTEDEARDAARAFRDLTQCESVMITRGEHGLWLLDRSAGGAGVERNLTAVAREVADVTGAGDTVIATVAMTLAAGGSLTQAAELANHAAGIAVAKFGPTAVTHDELLLTLTVR